MTLTVVMAVEVMETELQEPDNTRGKEPWYSRTRGAYDASQRYGPPGFGGRNNDACDDGAAPAPTSQSAPKPKPSLFGPEINSFARLDRQLDLPPAFYTNGSRPIVSSALPTHHVCHGVTNTRGRGGATTSHGTVFASVGPGSTFFPGRHLFSQKLQFRGEMPVSY